MKSRFEKSGGGDGDIFSEFVVFCGKFSIISAGFDGCVCVCAGAVKP